MNGGQATWCCDIMRRSCLSAKKRKSVVGTAVENGRVESTSHKYISERRNVEDSAPASGIVRSYHEDVPEGERGGRERETERDGKEEGAGNRPTCGSCGRDDGLGTAMPTAVTPVPACRKERAIQTGDQVVTGQEPMSRATSSCVCYFGA